MKSTFIQLIHTPFHWLGLHTTSQEEVSGRGLGGVIETCDTCGAYCEDVTWVDLLLELIEKIWRK